MPQQAAYCCSCGPIVLFRLRYIAAAYDVGAGLGCVTIGFTQMVRVPRQTVRAADAMQAQRVEGVASCLLQLVVHACVLRLRPPTLQKAVNRLGGQEVRG